MHCRTDGTTAGHLVGNQRRVRQEFMTHQMAAPSTEIRELLQATIERFVAPGGSIAQIEPMPIAAGLSGDVPERFQIVVRGGDATRSEVTTRLVVKPASLVERKTLAHLLREGVGHIPFNHTRDLVSDQPRLLCMQDLGDQNRPYSLDPITPDLQRAEADAWAGIHAANLGRRDELAWLPLTSRAYFYGMIERQFFRPNWERAKADPTFVARFGDHIDEVDHVATHIVDDMVAIHDEENSLTLVHTDVNPGNVRLLGGKPYVIDWGTAHYGAFYIDIPHHFDTVERALIHHAALARRGIAIPEREYVERFRVAARYTGLRYIWWTLDGWQTDRSLDTWVGHYLRMIRM